MFSLRDWGREQVLLSVSTFEKKCAESDLMDWLVGAETRAWLVFHPAHRCFHKVNWGQSVNELLLTLLVLRENTFNTVEESIMKGLNLSRGILVLLLLWTLSVVAGAAGAVSTERGGAGRSQRRGGGGGGGGSGADKRRRFHRIQHGQCSYTFILPELDGCQSGGSEQYGGSRGGASIVQRDSPPVDGEWSAQKLQHLESTMENNTQWLRKVRDKARFCFSFCLDVRSFTHFICRKRSTEVCFAFTEDG